MASKQSLKQGEKVLFGIFGAFLVAAVIGYVVLETVRMNSDKPMFESKTHYALSEEGLKGSVIFREKRCTSCHRAMRNGTNMGLNLDGVGSKRSLDWIYAFLKDPESIYGAATLDHGFRPKEAAYASELPENEMRALAVFISELKSDQGSSSSPVPPKGESRFIDGVLNVMAPEDWKDKYQDIREKNNDAVEEIER